MAIRVLAVGNNNTTQTDHRSLITALTVHSSSVAHRGGLLPTNSPANLSNVSAMVVGVSGFKGVVPNFVGAGHYLVQSDAVENLTFDPGEAGVTRTDRIIVRVYNNPQDGSGLETVAVEYLKGQTSGSASPLPNNSLLLWEIPVPAGASSGSGGINFTSIAQDRRVYTTASGGVIPVTNATEMNAIQNPYEGMAALNRAADILYIYDGSLWRPKGQVIVPTFAALATNVLNPEDGTIATVRDTDLLYVYNGTAWQKYPARTETHHKSMLATIDGVNITAYGDMPAGSSVAITKLRSDTRLKVEIKSLLYSNGTSTGIQLGVRIGATDYDITKGYFTQAVYLPITGWDYISGVAAGTYTVQGRWKRFSGAGTWGSFSGISEFQMTITEVPA